MRTLLIIICVIVLVVVQGVAVASPEALDHQKVEAWMQKFDAAVNGKNTQSISNMLAENFEYEQSSTAQGSLTAQSKNEFIAELIGRKRFFEQDKELDISTSENSALVIQERKVAVVQGNMTINTVLIDYFYLGQEDGKTVLLRIQTEEQSDETKMTFTE